MIKTLMLVLGSFLVLVYSVQNYFALPESNTRVAIGLFFPIAVALVVGWIYIITRLKLIAADGNQTKYRFKVYARSLTTVIFTWFLGAFCVHSFFLVGSELFSWTYYEGSRSLGEIEETKVWLQALIGSGILYAIASLVCINAQGRKQVS